jgi:hypothetical protein
MEFWKELGKKENMNRILVKTINKIYETEEVRTGWKTMKGKGYKENSMNYRESHYCQPHQGYTGALGHRLNNWVERKGEVLRVSDGI